MTIALWVIAVVILNMSFWLARFLKPFKTMVETNTKQLEELQRSRLELSKAADEIAKLRKDK